MTYENFISKIKEIVECLCPNDRVCTENITKNNSVIKEAIVIHRAGENTTPTIYLKDFYFEYMNGTEIQKIAEEIVRISEEGRGRIDFDIKSCQDFSKVKHKLLCKLINAERNKELLERCPNRRFLDFALVYYCAEIKGEDFGTWIVTDAICKNWRVCEEDLYKTAMCNLSRLMPPDLMKITEAVKTLMENEEDLEEFGDVKMYVLTNSRKIFGATSLLCGNILREFAEEHGNFYILPSSIHEVIFIACNDVDNPAQLKPMVEDVNTYHIAKEEYLSDEVYFYTIDDQEIHRLRI